MRRVTRTTSLSLFLGSLELGLLVNSASNAHVVDVCVFSHVSYVAANKLSGGLT